MGCKRVDNDNEMTDGAAVLRKLHFIASGKQIAQNFWVTLTERYGQASLAEADCVVALGGDGTALRALALAMPQQKPVFGLRLEGSVGFLGNDFRLEGLTERIQNAASVRLHPLQAAVTAETGSHHVLGINEIALVRQGRQTAKLRVLVDGEEFARHLTGDGLLVATPIGSTAYNRSAGGAVLGFESHLIALTALLPFRSGEWYNRVLADTAIVTVEVIEPDYRRIKLEAGQQTVDNVRHVRITRSSESLTLLFDRDRSSLGRF